MPDLIAREKWVVAPLLGLMLVFGFLPGPALDLVRPPATVTLDQVGVQDVPVAATSHVTDERERPVTDFIAPTIDWAALSPVVIVLLAAVVGVLVEAFVPARVRRTVQLSLAIAALAGAIVAVAALWSGVEETGGTVVLGGSLLVDGPTLVMQATIALLGPARAAGRRGPHGDGGGRVRAQRRRGARLGLRGARAPQGRAADRGLPAACSSPPAAC